MKYLVFSIFALFLVFCGAFAAPAITNASCMECHSDQTLTKDSKGEKVSLWVNAAPFDSSVHGGLACADCHRDIRDIPHEENLKRVDCGQCHEDAVQIFSKGIHFEKGKENTHAANCSDCHGKHDVLSSKNRNSTIHYSNLAATCGRCHYEKNPYIAAGPGKGYIEDYQLSIHGKGLRESGLSMSAKCSDCHGFHDIYRSSDPRSPVQHKNIPVTCGKCHEGIEFQFSQSIHGQMGHGPDELHEPVCTDCHSSHSIRRVDGEGFKLDLNRQCGQCHQKLVNSYFETYHGKVNHLGFSQIARCSDCHGSHNIRKAGDTLSTIHTGNIVATCRKCHPNANKSFAKFIAHPDWSNRSKAPWLYYAHMGMLAILVGTFGFFGLHTILWLFRSLVEKKKVVPEHSEGPPVYIRRFSTLDRFLHVLVITSFLGLAFTGMMLKFAHMQWAAVVAQILGGYHSAGLIHRICAIITFGYFAIHILSVAKKVVQSPGSRWKIFWGPDSLVPQPSDLADIFHSFRWFLGFGPAPRFGRWTYWEKFDYLAVFWGVSMIGISGLLLWFPEFFSRFLPGWAFNVATIIHSEEAIMAVGFIFMIHFFNTHLRPNKFPMDTVIFSGMEELSEMKKERPLYVERLEAENRISNLQVPEYPRQKLRIWTLFGGLAVFLGCLMMALIFISLFSK